MAGRLRRLGDTTRAGTVAQFERSGWCALTRRRVCSVHVRAAADGPIFCCAALAGVELGGAHTTHAR